MKWLNLSWFFKTAEQKRADERLRGYHYALNEMLKGVSAETLMLQAESLDKTEFDYGIRDCVLDSNHVKVGELCDR